jgi:N-carbamoylputrescine amidase
MARIIKSGLIQMSSPRISGEASIQEISDAIIQKHIPYIEEAGRKGVQILCLQEIFNLPYFCISQDHNWFNAAELVPGPTTDLMAQYARKYQMVIIVPLFESEQPGVFYNTAAVVDADGTYLGKYRKNHIPHVDGYWEKFFYKPGNLAYPVFQTRYAKIGVCLGYDRHFPEAMRSLALNGAEIAYNPSVEFTGLTESNWRLALSAQAASNAFFVACTNRVGGEQPWSNARFYGSSYFADPRGQVFADASAENDELLIAEFDLKMINDVRNKFPFFRDRRPETYARITDL